MQTIRNRAPEIDAEYKRVAEETYFMSEWKWEVMFVVLGLGYIGVSKILGKLENIYYIMD